MPRNFVRITTTIWNDDDFKALTLEQQGLYFLLDSQRDLTAAGILPLTTGRWSNMSADMTAEHIDELLDTLVKLQHILIDADTQELLIRTFIKWDGGFTNAKRIPVIRDAAFAIASPFLRDAVAIELDRVGLTDIASRLGGNSPYQPAGDSLSPPSEDALSRFRRVGDTYPIPHSATPTGEPFAEPGEPPSEFCSKHPAGTEKPCGACGTARKRLTAWTAQAEQRAKAEQAARSRALANCPHCNDAGWLLPDLEVQCTIHRQPGAS